MSLVLGRWARRWHWDFRLFGDLGDLWRRIGLGRMQILAMKAKSVIPLAVQDVDGHLSIPFLSFVSFGFIGFMV